MRDPDVPEGWTPRTYSLWRGEVRLGTFVGERPTTHHGEVSGAHGLFSPEVPIETLSGLWQIDFGVPGMPVMQHDSPPTDLTAPPPATRDRSRQEVALERGRPMDTTPLPPERLLTVRDDTGAVLATRQILLEDHIIDADIARRAGLPEDATRMFRVAFFTG